MACSGPSKEFAIIKSQQAHDEIMQLISNKYHVMRPDNQGDEWDLYEATLREALASLFWHSDAMSF